MIDHRHDLSRAERRQRRYDHLMECIAIGGALLLLWLIYWVFI